MSNRLIDAASSIRLRGPVMTFSLAAIAGIAFAAIVMMSYPQNKEGGVDADQAVPIIRADVQPFKVMPDDPGGMDIAHLDSTVFDAISPSGGAQHPRVENLFAMQEREMPAKDETFEQALEQSENSVDVLDITESVDLLEDGAPDISEATEKLVVEATKAVVKSAVETAVETDEKVTSEATPSPAPVAKPKKEAAIVAETPAPNPAQQKAAQLYAAGTSPDTLEFVRSVLDRKDEKSGNLRAENTMKDGGDIINQADVEALADTEPAAGVAPVIAEAIDIPATGRPVVTERPRISGVGMQPVYSPVPEQAAPKAAQQIAAPGDYYIQLGSVSSRDGADGEWKRLQKELSAQLSGLGYRVSEADLGERGTFYRIQAGPLAKSAADELCGAVKAQKPGGCLVVRR